VNCTVNASPLKTLLVIPVRMGSSRFYGKPMEKMCGIPMVGHCYHRAKLAKDIDDVYVATCDEEIYDYVKAISGDAVMTADTHERATDRTAEALERIEKDTGKTYDIIIMLQGDEPMVAPQSLTEMVQGFAEPEVDIVNIISEFQSFEAFADVNNVKVVFDKNMSALYFSRETIPSPWKTRENLPKFMQVGIIAFRREALNWFQDMEETPLERFESVDMNRVLEYGRKIHLVVNPNATLGVDTPEELATVEGWLTSDPVTAQYS